MRHVAYVASMLLVMFAFVSDMPAQEAEIANPRISPVADLEAIQEAFAQIAESLRPSVVAIRAIRQAHTSPTTSVSSIKQPEKSVPIPSIGSGVIIREDGRILTNEHVVQGAEQIQVILHNGKPYTPRAVYSDPRSDLAIVVIEETGLQSASLGDLADVKQGHWALAMGNPYGMGTDHGMIMSHGIVSAVGQKLRLDPSNLRYYGNLIQTTAAINPGNSGGPLVNIHGEVIGINTAISTRSGANEGVGFAVPIESRTRAIIDTLMRGEPMEYAYLGVTAHTPEAQEKRRADRETFRGAWITRVEPGSPAEKGRIEVNDIIVEFDGHTVEDADHLVRLVGVAPIGHDSLITFIRDGRRSQTRVLLVRQPSMKKPRDSKILRWRGALLGEPTETNRKQLSQQNGATGLMILEVDSGSLADRAGLKTGQVIIQFGELQASSLRQVAESLPVLTGPIALILSDRSQVRIPAE